MVVSPVLAFFAEYKWVLLFYGALILLIYWYKDKFDWQGIIGLYRTKLGLKTMDRLGKHEKLFQILGTIAIVVGFLGMLFIVGMLFQGLYNLVFVPDAPPVISPVIPGAKIPGLGIKVPLIIGWVALFFVIVIHEFSHGVVARAYKIPVKSSGLMVFGPIGGAFVEPDEKKLKKVTAKAQLGVFAAGPFSNLVLAGILALTLIFVFNPLLTSFVATDGVVFGDVTPGYPAQAAGVQTGVVYDRLNDQPISTEQDFLKGLEGLQPGDVITLESTQTAQRATIVAAANPTNESKGYLGVVLTENLKRTDLRWVFLVVAWFVELVMWTFILSLGIGLANLLPLGPVDGGRMLLTGAVTMFGEETGKKIWSKASWFMLGVILILLLVPLIRYLFF